MGWMRELSHGDTAVIAAEAQGEVIRWVGRPDKGGIFRHAFAIYGFAIPWSAVAFTMLGVLVAAMFSGKPVGRTVTHWEYVFFSVFVIVATLFSAVGIGMLASPFWARWKAARTMYVVTDRHTLTIVNGNTRRVEGVEPERILKIVKTARRGGSGSLGIVTGYGKDSDGDTIEQTIEFSAVKDVAGAERAVEALQRRARDR